MYISTGKRSSKVKDKECAARAVDGKSVVCVCNDTYCDTITRDVPDKGSYVSYTSSKVNYSLFSLVLHPINYSIINYSKILR